MEEVTKVRTISILFIIQVIFIVEAIVVFDGILEMKNDSNLTVTSDSTESKPLFNKEGKCD